MHKHKNNKKIKRGKKGTKRTLPYGRLPNLSNLSGLHPGDKVDQAGILSARQWLYLFWVRKWIFILEGLI